MIKIDKILPLGKTQPVLLKSLKKDYFQKIEGLNHIPALLFAINDKKIVGYDLTRENINCLKYIAQYYKEIILGSPRQLEKTIKDFERNGWNADINSGNKRTAFGYALSDFFGYTERFRSVQNGGVWLALQLNIKVCPYCNCQYTLVVDYKKGKSLAKFQFDHYFPLERFPYLSLSLFNIIPSCASCNHRKRNAHLPIDKFYHPYCNSMAWFSEFRVKFPGDFKKLLFPQLRKMDIEKIDIKLVSKYTKTDHIVEAYDELFNISSIYQRHKDIAHSLLINAALYDRYYQNATMGIKNLFPDKKTMLKYILGNYLEEGDILKRPLSKFTQDVARGLKLIK